MFITNGILFAKCRECFKFTISNGASKLTNTDNFQRNDSNFLSFPISKHPGEKKDQPHLIIIGDPLNVAQIYISFYEEKTEIQSLRKAVDLCFKLYFVFNTEFPEESHHNWTFTQRFF
jgi:hypothetical protein